METRRRPSHLANVIDRNIKTLLVMREQMERRRNFESKLADKITAFCGSIGFVYFHIGWFSGWILWNVGLLPNLSVFDPFPFGLLTTTVSLEAIFLSMFVLISQNRMGVIADQRADLDLQINLLAEYEITKILQLTDAMADHFEIEVGKDPELDELKINVPPDKMLQEMERMKVHRNGKSFKRTTDPDAARVS